MADTVLEYLEKVFDERKNNVALIAQDGEQVTFADTRLLIHSFAENLIECGVRPGDVVVPSINNFTINFMLRIACLYVGATALLTLGAGEKVREKLNPDWMIVDGEGLSKTAGRIHFNRTWIRAPQNIIIPAKEFGIINASSGSTGVPKFFFRDQMAITSTLFRSGSNRPAYEGATLVAYGAASGVGFHHPFRILLSGNTVVCIDVDAISTVKRLNRYRVDRLLAPPKYLQDLAEVVEKKQMVFPSLKTIYSGGGSISRTFARRCEQFFECEVYSTYGSTETGAIAFGRPAISDVEIGYVGEISPLVSVKFVDEMGNEQDGEIGGEILVKPAEGTEITKVIDTPFPYDDQGFSRPGDVGRLDANGNLIISGRVKDIINSGGNKISPSVIESEAFRYGLVKQATAFGLPNEFGSEDVGLAIIGESDFDIVSFKDYMKNTYGKRFEIRPFEVDEMPQTQAQKIDRNALREIYYRKQTH